MLADGFRRSKTVAQSFQSHHYDVFQFSSVQSLSHVRLFVTPWIAAHQASLSITRSWSLPKLMCIESVMPSSHLSLCCPLLLPQIPPSIRVFSNESTLRMRWPKYWSFSLSIIPSREITGLIAFRMAIVFPVVMYGCESWTVKKAERRRINAFELWCWRRLLRVPWMARRSSQSILKEISPGFIGRTDAKAETPIIWPPYAKSWLIGKDYDAGRDLGQEKGTTEDEMAG